MLYGDPGDYLASLEARFQLPVCTFTLRFLASMRAAHASEGTMLVALAQIESQVASFAAGLLAAAPPPSRFIAPPQ